MSLLFHSVACVDVPAKELISPPSRPVQVAVNMWVAEVMAVCMWIA